MLFSSASLYGITVPHLYFFYFFINSVAEAREASVTPAGLAFSSMITEVDFSNLRTKHFSDLPHTPHEYNYTQHFAKQPPRWKDFYSRYFYSTTMAWIPLPAIQRRIIDGRMGQQGGKQDGARRGGIRSCGRAGDVLWWSG